MRFQRHYKMETGEINFIPLINIVLLITIYFILISSFISTPVVNIGVSRAGETKQYKNKIFLNVSSAGEIFSEGKKISLQELGSFLKEFKGNMLVIIKGQSNTPNGIMVRIINKIHKAGINNIAISSL